MKDQDIVDLSWDDFDELRDPRADINGFDAIVDRAISRRGFMSGVLAFGSGAAVFGSGVLAGTQQAVAQTHGFAFEPIGISTDHNIHVPEGYEWKAVVRWGDALFSDATSAYSPVDGVDLSQALRATWTHPLSMRFPVSETETKAFAKAFHDWVRFTCN